jgi:transcriptional regulator with XRE-family HTH domain
MPKIDPRTVNIKLETALTSARKAKGLTQIDVAKRLGKPQSFVSKYETGERRLTVGHYLAVCEALEIKPAKILDALK